MLVFDKSEIRESLTNDNIFDLLDEFGADPEYKENYILAHTICHNHRGEGSAKLYYYFNSGLFRCYTGCDESTFDIFELVIKTKKIQENKELDLNDAVRWIAQRFGFLGRYDDNDEIQTLEDWKYLENYERIDEISFNKNEVILKEYNVKILENFNYSVKLTPWLKEGITQQVLNHAFIGYYPHHDQITIPHFDRNGRFIGLRGRSMCSEDADQFGKYRPIRIGGNLQFSHPLGMNLYNLNNSKKAIKTLKKAIVYESEKATLLHQSYFGFDNDISVACCGSSLSSCQVQLLLEAGAEEIIIAFDRQFQKIGDDEFFRLQNNLLKIREKYKNSALISFIFDKRMITGYKCAPIDCGPDKFIKLYDERIIL